MIEALRAPRLSHEEEKGGGEEVGAVNMYDFDLSVSSDAFLPELSRVYFQYANLCFIDGHYPCPPWG